VFIALLEFDNLLMFFKYYGPAAILFHVKRRPSPRQRKLPEQR
jgi:hypothetical protein